MLDGGKVTQRICKAVFPWATCTGHDVSCIYSGLVNLGK